jgi:hypothetical protein
MALKKKITKAEFDKLSKDLQSEYVEDGEGYRLDVDGEEDTGALKRAKDRETQLRKDAEKKAKELEDKLAEIDGNDARKKGDIETLEKQWKEKHQKEIEKLKTEHETEKTTLTERIGKYEGNIKKQLVDNVALQLATKLNSKSPKVLLPHIKERLMADLEGDEPVTKILGSDGKPSKLTIEQLEAEFVANKDFAGIIIGSKASGSAGNGNKPNGSANNSSDQQAPDLSKMNPKDLAEHMKQVREQQTQEA